MTQAIPFFGAARENEQLLEELLARVSRVLRSGKVLQGDAVARFEERLAERVGRRYAIAVGSGSDALLFALQAVGVGIGEDVLCPDVSFVATALAIVRAGATPRFVDVAEDAMLDLAAAEAALTPRTRAMVFVPLFGDMRPPEPIEAFAKRHGLILIEDAAQGFGASHGDRYCGSMGAASAISFDPTKVLSAPGSGGAVVTDDADIAAAVRRFRYHGREDGRTATSGGNSQMSSVVAEVLDAKLDHHEAWTRKRSEIAQSYRSALAGGNVMCVSGHPGTRHGWHKFVLRSEDRDSLAEALRAQAIPTAIHYPVPLHAEPLFARPVPDTLHAPNAFDHARTALSLPIHAHLRDDEVEHICAALTAAVGARDQLLEVPCLGASAS
jgi:dTDP-4-amino-4,6-dideoxygalactose transaminase